MERALEKIRTRDGGRQPQLRMGYQRANWQAISRRGAADAPRDGAAKRYSRPRSATSPGENRLRRPTTRLRARLEAMHAGIGAALVQSQRLRSARCSNAPQALLARRQRQHSHASGWSSRAADTLCSAPASACTPIWTDRTRGSESANANWGGSPRHADPGNQLLRAAGRHGRGLGRGRGHRLVRRLPAGGPGPPASGVVVVFGKRPFVAEEFSVAGRGRDRISLGLPAKTDRAGTAGGEGARRGGDRRQSPCSSPT